MTAACLHSHFPLRAMEVEPVLASHTIGQLRARNAAEGYFSGIIADYQTLLTRNRELQVRHAVNLTHTACRLSLCLHRRWKRRLRAMPDAAWEFWCLPCPEFETICVPDRRDRFKTGLQVRNAQLDKEASELRLENTVLSETVEVSRVAAVNNEEVRLSRRHQAAAAVPCSRISPVTALLAREECCGMQVVALREQAKTLQAELNAVYKEKAALAAEVLAATKQLAIVRENFEQHDRALTERSNALRELKAVRKEQAAQIAQLVAAQEEGAKELEALLPPAHTFAA